MQKKAQNDAKTDPKTMQKETPKPCKKKTPKRCKHESNNRFRIVLNYFYILEKF